MLSEEGQQIDHHEEVIDQEGEDSQEIRVPESFSVYNRASQKSSLPTTKRGLPAFSDVSQLRWELIQNFENQNFP